MRFTRRRFLLTTSALLCLGALCLGLGAARVASAAEDIMSVHQVSFAGAPAANGAKNGSNELGGTLILPAGMPMPVGGYPALVLLQGSGPTDRDGNQSPALRPDLLRGIAEHLATKGIATLRYDKRGMHANAPNRPEKMEEFGEYFRWENFVGDAAGAYRYLAAQSSINPARIGIFGHSEGGLIALAALSQLPRPPAAMVLAATPGRPLGDVVAEQLNRAMDGQKATPAQRKAVIDANKRISALILADGRVPEGVPAGLAPLYPSYAGLFLQALLKLDPATLGRDYAGPVLILQGASDIQVSAERDAGALQKAFAARRGALTNLVVLPNTSHNFKQVTNPATDPGISGPILPALLAALDDFLASHLAARD